VQLYFIRHGQSRNNHLYAQTGSSAGRSDDPELTPVGRQQVEHLARFLAQPGNPEAVLFPDYDVQNVGDFGLTHLYCSLMVRAVETGAILARALGLPLVAWEEVHEVGGIHHVDRETSEHHGLPGKNRAYFERKYPDLVLPPSLDEAGWWNRPFEERPLRLLRARRVLQELVARHGNTDDRVAVISHGGFYQHLLQAILDLPDVSEPWFSMNNAAISRIDFEDDEIGFRYTNRVGYLPGELIT
jgi:2,3-bisphosphoglycerate-dependent phosphoglycerate mutase